MQPTLATKAAQHVGGSLYTNQPHRTEPIYTSLMSDSAIIFLPSSSPVLVFSPSCSLMDNLKAWSGHATLLGSVTVWNSVLDMSKVAPWSSWAEFHGVYLQLTSSSPAERTKGVRRVETWMLSLNAPKSSFHLCACGPLIVVPKRWPLHSDVFILLFSDSVSLKHVEIEENKMPFASCSGYYSQLCGNHVEWCIPQSRDRSTTKRQRITTHVCHGCRTFGEWNRGLVLSFLKACWISWKGELCLLQHPTGRLQCGATLFSSCNETTTCLRTDKSHKGWLSLNVHRDLNGHSSLWIYGMMLLTRSHMAIWWIVDSWHTIRMSAELAFLAGLATCSTRGGVAPWIKVGQMSHEFRNPNNPGFHDWCCIYPKYLRLSTCWWLFA